MKIFALHRRLQLPLLVGVLIVLTVILCVAGCTSPAPLRQARRRLRVPSLLLYTTTLSEAGRVWSVTLMR